MLKSHINQSGLLTPLKRQCSFSVLFLLFPQFTVVQAQEYEDPRAFYTASTSSSQKKISSGEKIKKQNEDFDLDDVPSRQGKTLGMYFTTGYSPLIYLGGVGSYFIFPNVLAELGFEYMTYGSEFTRNGSHYRIPLTGRWFFWNNLSASGGVALDSISEDRYVPVLANSHTLGVMHANRLAIEVEVHIGHRWILWEGFTLGCDWFGFAIPALEIRKKFSSIEYLRPDSEKTSQDIFLRSVEQHSLHFFKVVAGWAF